MVARTKLADRVLPNYTVGEEIFNMTSHIVGASFGAAALVLCVLKGVSQRQPLNIVAGAIYGLSLILLYTMSSIYHGLRPSTGKKVMQIIDHFTIYFLIGGSYTPITLCGVMKVSPVWAWSIFGVVWGLAIFATVLTAIDLKRYAVFSMICYVGMGWCIMIASKAAFAGLGVEGMLLLLAGGLFYTVGAVLYVIGRKEPYMHCVFHVFVVLGSILHFFAIYYYAM